MCLTNEYELKQDFTTFLKYLDMKPVLMKLKNSQSNTPVEKVHQVILSILGTKVLANKVVEICPVTH